jgi:hypothetical protein
MTFKEKLHSVLGDCLAEKPIFLIDLVVTDAFKVIVARWRSGCGLARLYDVVIY